MTLKPRQWASIVMIAFAIVPLLWFLLAYAGLPRLWSHHEHPKIGGRDSITSYTAQDIPSDPINLHVYAPEGAIAAAYQKAGWSRADPISLRTGLSIGLSVLTGRMYSSAPVSPLFVEDRYRTSPSKRTWAQALMSATMSASGRSAPING